MLGGLGAGAFVGALGLLVLGSDTLGGAWGTIFEHLIHIARGARELMVR